MKCVIMNIIEMKNIHGKMHFIMPYIYKLICLTYPFFMSESSIFCSIKNVNSRSTNIQITHALAVMGSAH